MEDICYNLKELDKKLDKLLKDAPEKRRALHARLAAELLNTLQPRIPVRTGRLRSWQETDVGSGGGYAAVRPKYGAAVFPKGRTYRRIDRHLTGRQAQYRAGSRTVSMHDVTYWVEEGHKTRKPSGKAKKYKPKIRDAFVDGQHFYDVSRKDAKKALERAAEEFAEDFAKELMK